MAKKIMIFDDDVDLLEICSLILTSSNFEVVLREKCNNVIQDVLEHYPDVILMDNWIPDLGGVNATRLLKADLRISSIPVIFFSASDDVRDLAAEAGADYALQKPFDLIELERIITKAANRSIA